MEKTIKESYTRAEVIKLLKDIAFHYSDNGDPDTDPHGWLNGMEGVDDGHIDTRGGEDEYDEDEFVED